MTTDQYYMFNVVQDCEKQKKSQYGNDNTLNTSTYVCVCMRANVSGIVQRWVSGRIFGIGIFLQ